MVIVYTAKPLVLSLLAAVFVVLLPCVFIPSYRYAKRMAAQHRTHEFWRQHSKAMWRTHPRWSEPWVHVGLALGLYLGLVGVVWVWVVGLMHHPLYPELSLGAFGFVPMALGAFMLAGCGLWAMYDPQGHDGPACGLPVSKWCFRGTYLAPEAAGEPEPEATSPVAPRKGHVACMRCCECRTVVAVDRWEGGPAARPCHAQCWQRHCHLICSDADYVRTWCKDQGEALTGAEVGYMLAATLQQKATTCTMELVSAYSDILDAPIPVALWPSAWHCAAELGNEEALRWLLEEFPGSLDVGYVHEGLGSSLWISGMGLGSDLYVWQEPLKYNGKPVYIGQSYGHYLYYYEPTDADQKKHAPGWTASEFLGSGSPSFRLQLPELSEDSSSDGDSDGEKAEGLGNTELVPFRLRFRRRTKRKATSSHGQIQGLSSCLEVISAADAVDANADDLLGSPSQPDPPAAPTTLETLTHHNLGIVRVPHSISLLEAAAASGSAEVVELVVQEYLERHPQCLRWEYHIGHGFWVAYPDAVQRAIAAALSERRGSTAVHLGGSCALLNFGTMVHSMGGKEHRLRHVCQSMTLHRRAGGEWAPTGTVSDVHDWTTAVHLPVPGACATCAPSLEALQMLAHKGLTDPSLWQVPCKTQKALKRQFVAEQQQREEWFAQALQQFFSTYLEIPEGLTLEDVVLLRHTGGKRAGQRASESRFTDGLTTAPAEAVHSTFYDADYHPSIGSFEFCMALADNPLGLVFEKAALYVMCTECILKVHELQRQRVSHALSPLHIAPIFMYTYELAHEGDQIYSAMNRAMRERDTTAVEYWRPLIWQVDKALQVLPSYKGKLYRGIDLRFDEADYREGQLVCWPAFSSASAERSVAEDFVKGGEGTLFLITSVGAKPISRLSRFPDEAEVLFPPNTSFRITSTLYGTSDIGQFYSFTDNIAMEEKPHARNHGTEPEQSPRIANGCRNFVRDDNTALILVPSAGFYSVLDLVSRSHAFRVLDVQDNAGSAR